MTGKELVKRAIEFSGPERVPCNFDAFSENITLNDMRWVIVSEDPDFVPGVNSGGDLETEFGTIYRTLGDTMGECIFNPLKDLENLKSFKVPDFSNPRRYAGMEEAIRLCSDKYILGMFPHFLFLDMLDLFGFENFMYQLVDSREEVEYVCKLLTDSAVKVVHCMADRGVDGVIAIEDLGVQDRLLISPQLWREIFKPAYKRIFSEAHSRGMHVMMHSCGYIIDLLEELIEIGLDVIQIDQQDNMGIDRLAERYGGRICFYSPVDIQSTLPCGTREEIEAKAKHLMKAFGTYNGGFMAKTYPQPEAIGLPVENIEAMCEAFERYGKYPLRFS